MDSTAMRLLLIEDNTEETKDFVKCVNSRNDVILVAATNSDIEGLKYLNSKHIDGIILDYELNYGSGNLTCIEFLKSFKTMKFRSRPKIIIVTHVNSDSSYDFLHKNGADLILYKDHPKYSCEYVIKTMLLLRDNKSSSPQEYPKIDEEDMNEKISSAIYHELDLIGIVSKLKGREYLHDAIYYLIKNFGDSNSMNVIQYLTTIYKKSGSTITKGIQNAIIHAWRVMPDEDLSTLYTAIINYETGIPTPMEFIYYYVDKIRKIL